MKYTFTLCAVFIFSCTLFIIPSSAQSIVRLPANGPQGFIENRGQFLDENRKLRTDLLYMLQRDGIKVQLMQNRISIELYTIQNSSNGFDEAKGLLDWNHLDPEDRPLPNLHYESTRMDLEFIGANPYPQIIAEEVMADYMNYYLAHTTVDGITGVKLYNKVIYKNLYKNIDLVLIATPSQNPQKAIAYDFIIHPGGNINDIRYRYNGATDQQLRADGSLETSTNLGQLVEVIPESYLTDEEGHKLSPVSVSFVKNRDIISFYAGSFDRKKSLVIDPLLIWATYCGGDSSEEGRGLTTDSLSNVAIVGRSNSTDNIATAGAFQTQLVADVDIMLEKYDSAGNRLWGTYYGGSAGDQARGLITDKQNNYFLGCHADSPDGLSTPGAYRENYAGGVGDDAVLAHFSKDGFRIWATYYGGTDEETIRRLCMDEDGNVIMIGYTFSDTGIATPGVYQETYGGHADVCLSKWTPDGQLIWGSYLGGDGEDHGRSVATDQFNNIYINGSTGSDAGIATPNAFRNYHSGKQDYLLGKFDTDGQILWTSYWGGPIEDRGRGVYVDSSGKYVYFMGYSAGDSGITTPGAYQEHWIETYDNQGEPYHDLVVMRWTADGIIDWSTYLGGQKDDRGRGITVIGDNEIYVGGSSGSFDGMATSEGFQTQLGGKDDIFLELFDSTGNRLWGTYMGEEGDEDLLALAVDRYKSYIYMVGTTSSHDIATPGTGQTVFGGDDDALVVKVQVHTPPLAPVASFSYINVPCESGQVSFTNNSINSDSYFWEFGDGSTSTVVSPLYTYSAQGDYTVTLIATNTGNSISDTSSMLISVVDIVPAATITPLGPTTFCEGGSVILEANTGIGYTYKWKNGQSFITGATNSSYTATDSGAYKVVITVSLGCSATSVKEEVEVIPAPEAIISEGASLSICDGTSGTLNANNDLSLEYQWLIDGSVIAGASTSSLSVDAAGNYSVIETNSFGCKDTSLITEVTIVTTPVASITASGVTTFCEGNSVDLIANSGIDFTYQWQVNNSDIPGATDISYTVTQSGNYSVIVTNAPGCFASSNFILITVNPNPTVTTTASDNSVCLNEPATLSASGAISYLWQPGNITSQSIQVTPEIQTTYSVTGTDVNGCTDEDAITIDVLPLPVITLGNDTIVCDTVNFLLDAGAGFNSYTWSTGETSQVINVPFTDDYWVVVEDNNNCKGSDTIFVTVTICSGVEMIGSVPMINVFPNPAKGNFTLSFINSPADKIKVELENTVGQKVMDIYEGQVEKFKEEINVRFLASGIYYVKIYSLNKVTSKKVVIH